MTRHSNKRWLHRLNLVTTLSEWVEANLSATHVVWDFQERDKKQGKHGRSTKAAQYVYGHLMIGRMLFPCTSSDPLVDDPLFAAENYPNESMELQLTPGAYPEFQEKVGLARLRSMTPDVIARIPTVTWEMVLRKVKPHIIPKLQRFASTSRIPQETLIGLVLRYLCVGGLDDNLHASITVPVAEAMGPDCVECFASPFNRKFATYYSLFDEDSVLGSSGNFFKAVQDNQGMLPSSFRRFEMNPPWINAVFERLVDIVSLSMSARNDLEIIVLGPQWTVTQWTPAFSGLLRNQTHAGYAVHSMASSLPQVSQMHPMQYIHDLSATKLFLRTVAWVFTCSEIPPSHSLREFLALSQDYDQHPI